MKIIQTPTFAKAVKKLHANQKKGLDKGISMLVKTPLAGEAKIGDLSGVRVLKFRINKQLTLVAYSYMDKAETITLLAIGSHENFYRDLKKST